MSTPIRDLTLLRQVIAYARTNGWTHDITDLSGLPRDHRWRRDGAEVNWFNACLYVNNTKFRPTTVRQAVNLLVDLDALPVTFHSAYAAGLAALAACIRCHERAATSMLTGLCEPCTVSGGRAAGTGWDNIQPPLTQTARAQRWDDGLFAPDEMQTLMEETHRRDEHEQQATPTAGCSICDALWLAATSKEPTAEPTRTLTAVERHAEQYIAPVGAEEVPVDVEARIAQALEYTGRAVVWPAAGADDPNDEITGGAK